MSLDFFDRELDFCGFDDAAGIRGHVAGQPNRFQESFRWRNYCCRSLCGWFCRLELLSAHFWTSDSQDDGNGRRAAEPVVSEHV